MKNISISCSQKEPIHILSIVSRVHRLAFSLGKCFFAIASSFEAEIKICATITTAWNENNGTSLGWILILDEG